jgi:hypothetical protein
MTHPDILAALGRERLNTLLADAEAARKARQARRYRRQAAAVSGLLRSIRAHLLRHHPGTAEYQISLSPGPADQGTAPADGAAGLLPVSRKELTFS